MDHPAHDQIIAVKRQPGNRLGPVRHVRAEFTGARGGAGPLTAGQARALSWVADTTQPTRMIDWILGLPPGAVLDDVIAAWRVLMARHEALRTSYPPGPKPVQRVWRSGELVIDVYEAGPQPAEIWPDLTAELARRLRSTEFDVTTELPVRVGVALANGVPRSAVVVLSHVAVDFGSMELLGREFSALAANPASADLPPAGHQPLDRAADERSPRGRSRADAALRSWRHQLERMPQCLYAVPYGAGSYRPEPAEFELRSAAGALALRHIAARTGATKSTAVLAALGAVLSWRTGHDECAFPVVVSNRYGRHLHGYVGPIARSGLLSLAVSGRSFDELVQAAATAMLRAGRSALVDHAELVKAFARAEYDRGIAFRRACVVNDVSVYWARPEAAQALPSATEVKAALRETCFARAEAAGVDELLMIILKQLDGELVICVKTVDVRHVGAQEVRSLLVGLESLLVEAAVGDFSLRRAGEITGLAPLPRPSSWRQVDSCWIELPEVQRLVDDALPGATGQIFAMPDAGGQPALVAYLAASEGCTTPAQAHAACMALLPGDLSARQPGGVRYTAMAPQRYVICDQAPADRSDLAAWQRRPVRADGPGR